MDVNGGGYPNPNGSPIFPGTQFTGPLLAGNVVHSDGTGNAAGLGETSGLANVGYAVMGQSQALIGFSGAATQATRIVVPAQSQIIDIVAMVTTVQTSGTVGIGISGVGTTALVAQGASIATLGQVNMGPTTSGQIANWDNVGNTDVQVQVTANATGAGVVTLTVTYLQGINLAS